MGLFGKLFSKQACGICGSEVGALSRTKLIDGAYLCSVCRKNTSGFFVPNRFDLEDTAKHLKYMELIDQVYEKEFAPLDKSQVDYCSHHGSHKIGFADAIGMFEIISPETKKSNKHELFRYDQIDSFGPYEVINSMNRSEGEKKFKETGVLIKLRCPLDYAKTDTSEDEKAMMHPYVISLKIPLQHNVDIPSGGDRIYEHLNAIFGAGPKNKAAKVASSAASMLLGGAPVSAMIPATDFSGENRAKYTKLADAAETRALNKPLRELN